MSHSLLSFIIYFLTPFLSRELQNLPRGEIADIGGSNGRKSGTWGHKEEALRDPAHIGIFLPPRMTRIVQVLELSEPWRTWTRRGSNVGRDET